VLASAIGAAVQMNRSIYLVNPAERAPGYHTLEVLSAWGLVNAVNFADLTMPTVAALLPPDWAVALCDERVQRLDLDCPAAVVGITGKVSQRDRMIEIAGEFRRRGKLVVIGGPYATLDPEDMRPHADILVRGEIEEIAARLFADIAEGRWQPEYEGTRPDLAASPVPRWDLYPGRFALAGQIQTSRGCPFEGEFCDVIQYLGRKQRWKDPEQVLRELDQLYRLGYRDVFFADDNFTVTRRRTRALLERVAEWNRARPAGRVRFATQASIDLARDEELLARCAEAGLTKIFVGIETPNQDSLAETHKRQNLRVDLAREVTKIVQAGVMVLAGIVVGFDHDDTSIFERQAAFMETLPVPIISISVLVAPAATPLFARMRREDRLVAHGRFGAGSLLDTNIRPKSMSADELKAGAAWLLNRVYAPGASARRLEAYVEASPAAAPRAGAGGFGRLDVALAQRLARYGEDARNLVARIASLSRARPDLAAELSYAMLFYCQVRFMLDYHGLWRPDVSERFPGAATAAAQGAA
jgi:radical SAM superfamily enzyme YgiQ (UPF0313 family)